MSAADGATIKAKLEKLKIDFRKGPIYQFFRETGPIEAYALVQTQAGVVNINTKVLAIFLFEDEAKAAWEYQESTCKNETLSFTIMPTKITRYKGF